MNSDEIGKDIIAFIDRAIDSGSDLKKWTSEEELEEFKIKVEKLMSNAADSGVVEKNKEYETLFSGMQSYLRDDENDVFDNDYDSFEILDEVVRRFNALNPKPVKKRRKTPLNPDVNIFENKNPQEDGKAIKTDEVDSGGNTFIVSSDALHGHSDVLNLSSPGRVEYGHSAHIEAFGTALSNNDIVYKEPMAMSAERIDKLIASSGEYSADSVAPPAPKVKSHGADPVEMSGIKMKLSSDGRVVFD